MTPRLGTGRIVWAEIADTNLWLPCGGTKLRGRRARWRPQFDKPALRRRMQLAQRAADPHSQGRDVLRLERRIMDDAGILALGYPRAAALGDEV
jgi:hypothetical protein